jgi:hypothetical protein
VISVAVPITVAITIPVAISITIPITVTIPASITITVDGSPPIVAIPRVTDPVLYIARTVCNTITILAYRVTSVADVIPERIAPTRDGQSIGCPRSNVGTRRYSLRPRWRRRSPIGHRRRTALGSRRLLCRDARRGRRART